MQDQYGNPVPADLQTLPSFHLLDEEGREAVFAADWWEADHVLLWANEKAVGGDDPRDAGLSVDEDGNLEGIEVLYVADALKRGNEIDGFYHA